MLQSLRGLGPYLRKYRTPMVLGTTCAVVADFLHLVNPRILGWAVDRLEVPGDATDRLLLWCAAGVIGISVAWGVFAYVMRRLMTGTSREIQYELQDRLFGHLMSLPAATHDRLRGGDVISRLTNDLAAVREVLGPGIMWMAQTGTLSILVAAMMLVISPRLALYALAPMPLLLVVTWWGSRATHKYSLQAQEALAELSNQATTAFGGIRVVKSFRREAAERAAFADRDAQYVRANLSQQLVRAIFMPAMVALPGLSLAAVLWGGTADVVAGTLTKGELLAFIFYVTMLIRPMMMLGWTISIHQRGAAALGRILEVLDEAPEDQGGAAAAPEPLEGELRWDGATVRYGGAAQPERPVLDGLDLQVAPGTFLAVVGPIGSGKSSLLLTLPRLLDPPRGQVSIDGVDVRDWPLPDLRRAIGMVPQLPFLFSASVRRNIAAGLAGDAGEVSEARIAAAASAAGLDPDLASWPDGLDTIVGERGVAVSGGQRQRIAIARALLADPPILLLDDCLSSLDAETAEAILAKLRAARQGRPRTTILATHRIAEAARCDRVAVLERGRVVQQGSHAALADTPGLYQRLVERQRLEAEISGGHAGGA